MTFWGLLFRVLAGYVAGLVIVPHVRRPRASWREVSIVGGFAAGLGASVPYLVLNSAFVEQPGSRDQVVSQAAKFVMWLAENVPIACLAGCVAAILIAGLRSRPQESPGEPTNPLDHLPTRKTWVWLFVPAVIYSAWSALSGPPITGTWLTYLVGFLVVSGVAWFVGSIAVALVRSSRPRRR